MPANIVIDTDFLSSFLKVGRVGLIREFYQVDAVHVASVVRRELSSVELDRNLIGQPWAVEHFVAEAEWEGLRHRALPTRVGAGEAAAIVLARSLPDSLLLISDSSARRIAEKDGVPCADIPAFLLACRSTGFLDREELGKITKELGEKDCYGFRQEVLSLLLA